MESEVYTELTYKMAKYKEVQSRMYFCARMAAQNSIGVDNFIIGAYLRMMLDAAANLCFVNMMSNSLKEKYLNHWLSGKPTNTFKLPIKNSKGENEKCSTGFLQRNIPVYDRLFKALNPLIHPSTKYLSRMIIEDDNSVFINREVISGDVSDMGVSSLYELELERYDKSMEQIQPTSPEYRELEYSDSIMRLKGEQPITIRIYKE